MNGERPGGYDWAGSRGSLWRDQLDGMEAMLAPVDAPLIEALALDAPLRIADIGCGGGGTARAIAGAAAPGSAVEGFDISPDLVAAATARGGSQARFTLADAASYRPAERFDRLSSRFGVMFFADPDAAFANLHTWLVPGGRLAFAVWGPGPEVSFMASVRAAIEAVMPLPPADPDAPGPCRYGDSQRLVALLERAGFRDGARRSWRGTCRWAAAWRRRRRRTFCSHRPRLRRRSRASGRRCVRRRGRGWWRRAGGMLRVVSSGCRCASRS